MNASMHKRFVFLPVALGLLLQTSLAFGQLAGGQGVKTVTLNDNVGRNQFTWLSEAPLENIKGSSEGVSGSFTMDPKNLTSIKGTVSTSVKTMKTGNETRDGHLMNAQWLDAGKYPVITFKIESVSDVKVNGNEARAIAHGDFSLHGVTKKLAIPFNLKYLPANEKTKARASGDLVLINATFNIALKDFNVAGAKGLVGSKVGETIKVSATLFGNTN